MIRCGTEMIIFGGEFDFYYLDRFDTWALEWGNPLDTTPPQVTVSLSRDMLWPPNEKLSEFARR
jgi:hypothetical protein